MICETKKQKIARLKKTQKELKDRKLKRIKVQRLKQEQRRIKTRRLKPVGLKKSKKKKLVRENNHRLKRMGMPQLNFYDFY